MKQYTITNEREKCYTLLVVLLANRVPLPVFDTREVLLKHNSFMCDFDDNERLESTQLYHNS